jgi:hypothetical protein
LAQLSAQARSQVLAAVEPVVARAAHRPSLIWAQTMASVEFSKSWRAWVHDKAAPTGQT